VEWDSFSSCTTVPKQTDSAFGDTRSQQQPRTRHCAGSSNSLLLAPSPEPTRALAEPHYTCRSTQCYILFRVEHRQTARRRVDSEGSTVLQTLPTSAACTVRTPFSTGVFERSDHQHPHIHSSLSYILSSYCSSLFHLPTLAKSPQQQLPPPVHPRPHPASAAHISATPHYTSVAFCRNGPACLHLEFARPFQRRAALFRLKP
jgi:hypothetical protein